MKVAVWWKALDTLLAFECATHLLHAQASLGETGGLEGSTNTSDMTAIMLESAFSETSMHDSLAVKNESNHGSPLEEVIVAPNSTAQGLIPADVELLKTVVDVLGAYAHKYNIGTEITIGAQPARDLTVATPKVFNSLSVVVLTYLQTYQTWGTCTEDKPCTQKFNKPRSWLDFWVFMLCYFGAIFLLCLLAAIAIWVFGPPGHQPRWQPLDVEGMATHSSTQGPWNTDTGCREPCHGGRYKRCDNASC